MDTQILQSLIDNNGSYLIANRYAKGYGVYDDKGTWEAIFMSTNIPRDLWDAKIEEMPYNKVINFGNTEIRTCIHFGKSYPPFQYGMYYKDLIAIKECTCNANDLIFYCYENNITDYYKVIEAMEILSKKAKKDA